MTRKIESKKRDNSAYRSLYKIGSVSVDKIYSRRSDIDRIFGLKAIDYKKICAEGSLKGYTVGIY